MDTREVNNGCRRVTNRHAVLILAASLLITAVTAYGHDNYEGGSAETEAPDKTGKQQEAARSYILAEDFSKAVSAYAALVRKDSSNVLLNAEYAYALSLNGLYDAALSRLDRIWKPEANTPVVSFFAAQIFALMGYDMLAVEFGKKIEAGTVPDWISSAASDFLVKYSDRTPGDNMSEGDDVVTDFRRANRLAAQNSSLMAVAMFEGIITRYPEEYLPYAGSSIALEKAGLLEKSVEAMEQAISIAKTKPDQAETISSLETRLRDLKNRPAVAGRPGMASLILAPGPGTKGKRMLVYAGGMFSPSFISLTGRVGRFISGSGSLSADFGVTRSAGATSLNIGVMNVFRQKIFAGGYGFGVGFGGGATSLNVKVSLGLSIMNSDKNASWDIFIDGQQPLSPKGYATTMALSVGRSVYFGTR
jgi:tetratricopeptide (TPR) repeat protein